MLTTYAGFYWLTIDRYSCKSGKYFMRHNIKTLFIIPNPIEWIKRGGKYDNRFDGIRVRLIKVLPRILYKKGVYKEYKKKALDFLYYCQNKDGRIFDIYKEIRIDPEEEKSKVKYDVETEFDSDNKYLIMYSVYSKKDGGYIGSPEDALVLYKRGIVPEKMKDNGNVCCIGFNEEEQKWYGWSHRAICGFKIGDIVKEGDCCAASGWTDEYIKEHPEEDKSLPVGFVAKTIDDAKTMAIAFAESVG